MERPIAACRAGNHVRLRLALSQLISGSRLNSRGQIVGGQLFKYPGSHGTDLANPREILAGDNVAKSDWGFVKEHCGADDVVSGGLG